MPPRSLKPYAQRTEGEANPNIRDNREVWPATTPDGRAVFVKSMTTKTLCASRSSRREVRAVCGPARVAMGRCGACHGRRFPAIQRTRAQAARACEWPCTYSQPSLLMPPCLSTPRCR